MLHSMGGSLDQMLNHNRRLTVNVMQDPSLETRRGRPLPATLAQDAGSLSKMSVAMSFQ
jgi:hypothetical protein